jgi:hypothetical protein
MVYQRFSQVIFRDDSVELKAMGGYGLREVWDSNIHPLLEKRVRAADPKKEELLRRSLQNLPFT